MLAWHNEPRLKAAAMERLREHRRLDQFAQGVYFESGRGCHLGCLTHRNEDSHEATERMFGIPIKVAHWLEAVFEGLDENKCAAWVIASSDSIPVGADLSLAHHRLCAWLLSSESPSAEGNQRESVKVVVATARGLHERASSGELISDAEWSAAESAAESAAWSAARSAGSAAGSAAWNAIAAKSIEIFRTLPIGGDNCDECAAESLASLAVGVTPDRIVKVKA